MGAAGYLRLRQLGDGAIDTTLFDADAVPFAGQILRTTWEELTRAEYVSEITKTRYRLTPKGWLLGLELVGASQSPEYQERLGKILAALKRYVKGRKESAVVELRRLAQESGEPEGWIFNIIDSRASSSTGSGRVGAAWFSNERGRLVEIPVDFNLEPIDIASSLRFQHQEKIQELEERIGEIEEDRAQFHCPYCDAEICGIAGEDFPNHHCYVTYEQFACGYMTADGHEEAPCPYGPKWPKLEEFEFVTKENGDLWICYSSPKTERARRVQGSRGIGRTKDEAEEQARQALAPNKK